MKGTRWNTIQLEQLEQLERLRSEDTPAASWLPILLSHIGSQVKWRQSQSYKFKEFAKTSTFKILKQTLHATHLLKLLDKICKYEMDPTSIVEDTERTRFCPQTERRTDGRTDGQTDFQLRWSGVFNMLHLGMAVIVHPAKISHMQGNGENDKSCSQNSGFSSSHNSVIFKMKLQTLLPPSSRSMFFRCFRIA